MARPRKHDADRLSAPLNLWLSAKDRAYIDRAAQKAGLSRSEYARKLLTDRTRRVGRSMKADSELRTLLEQLTNHLDRIGNNFNQGIKAAHSAGFSVDHLEMMHETYESVVLLLVDKGLLHDR